MATNEVFDGQGDYYLPVPAYAASGSAVVISGGGNMVGVCQTNRDSSNNASVRTYGVFNFATADAVASAGIAMYVVAATGVITTTSAGNVLFGVSLGAKKADGTVDIKIHQI